MSARPCPCAAILLAACALAASRAGGSEYSLTFGRSLNVWSWDHALAVNQRIAGRGLVLLNATHSRRISETAGFSRRSDGTIGTARIDWALAPWATLGAGVSADESALSTGDAESDVSSRTADLRARLTPLAELAVTPTIGRAWDSRRGIADAGLLWGAGVSWSPFPDALARRGLGLSIDATGADVRSRQGDASGEISLRGTYALGGTAVQSVSYIERRDDERYVSANADTTVLRRYSRTRNIAAELGGGHPWLGALQLRGEFTSSIVDDDASEDPASLKYRTDNVTDDWVMTTKWTLPLPRPSITYLVSLRRNTREGTARDTVGSGPGDLDRRRSDLAMSLSAGLAIGPRDSVQVSGALSLIRDHTPAAREVNDRDDYSRSIVARWRHAFRRGTSLETRIERIETHQVWLETERSGNNRWDRALNLWLTARSLLGPVALTQTGFFQASLEEFDFDYLTPTDPRSRNSRIGRVELAGAVPWAERGALTVDWTVEARTIGTLLAPDHPGERPDTWRIERNELAQVVRVELLSPLGRSWTLEPSAAVSRRREYRPKRPDWTPFDLGDRLGSQETLEVGAGTTWNPATGFLGGSEAFRFSVVRIFRRRSSAPGARTFSDSRTEVALTFRHTF